VFVRLADNQQEAACAHTHFEVAGTELARHPYAALQAGALMPSAFASGEAKAVKKYAWDKAKWEQLGAKQPVSKVAAELARECRKRAEASPAGTEAGLLKEMNRAFAKRQDITHYNF
jgi:hypothetical protein